MEIIMRGSAMTDYLYKRIFGKEIKKEMADVAAADEDGQKLLMVDTMERLSFVMCQQYEKNWREVAVLKEEDFFDWLDMFPPGFFLDKDTMSLIVNEWKRNTQPTSQVKNRKSRQSEK